MTIAENQKQGNQSETPKKSGFFTSEELDLLDLPEHGAGNTPGQRNVSQTVIAVLILTAAASFALGMLAERSMTGSNGVVGQGAATDAGSLTGSSADSAANSNAVQNTQTPGLSGTTVTLPPSSASK